MIMKIRELPTNRRIAGVHSVPITEDGLIAMAWDRNERRLTTVGGRLEDGETVEDALKRETVEEAGLLLNPDKITPFAAMYWDSTDSYTVYVVAPIERFVPMPEGFETTGRVIAGFETARQMVQALEGDGPRIELLSWAEQAAAAAGLLTNAR